MSQFLIDDVEVHFPFEPYEEQKAYMKKVIECITQRRVGVLESPTGTGKTLSLLCSTLSWLQQNRGNSDFNPEITQLPVENDEMFSNVTPNSLFPRVIYSSRTHSQLSKAMLELQKTAFRNFNVTILGSRDQMCIHPMVMKETNLSLKNALCAMHMKVKSCHFGNNVDKAKKDNTLFTDGITDIEDLITKSKKMACCPYYLARELQTKADVIFMPYNYLFDYHIRKALKISLVNAIVILDEAHNIDKVCEEASSVSIKSSDIALAITDITREMQTIYEEAESGYVLMEREYSNDELCFVKEKLTALESNIDEFPVTKDNSITHGGIYIFELLQKAGIDYNVAEELIRITTQIYEYLSNVTDASNRRGGSLKKFADDLTVIFSTIKGSDLLKADKNFRVHIEAETFKNFSHANKNSFKNEKPGKVVNYWCFNPGYCLGSTVKDEVRCVILTSGTLAPISSYVKEMALVNPVSVECSHIVGNDQVLVVKLEAGPRNIPLKCTYANRDNSEFWQELGLTLQNYFRIIPDGLLIFFPSYTTLNIAVKTWRDSGLWDKLGSLKPIFIEPQKKSELQQICSEYYKAIDTGRGKGATFLGVCRGKISEGLDFSDQYGRAVIVTGLPYPPLFDPKVRLKKQYIDNNKNSGDDMNGETWYMLEATKAVNQAIGRVIRHNKDYGAILLCDAQFNNKNVVQNLSKWVQNRIIKAKSFGDSVRLLSSFFRKNQCSMPPSPIKIPESSQKFACQASFSQCTNSQKRSDIKCLESYLSRISAHLVISQPGPSTSSISTQSENVLGISKISNNKSLNKHLKIVSNLVSHYEKSCNLNVPNDTGVSKSCLDSLVAEENSSSIKTSSVISLLNKDTLKNENLLGVLNKVLEEFEEKKMNLGPPPENIFEVGTKEDSDCFDRCPPVMSEPDKELQLDSNTCSVIRSLILRLQTLNRHLAFESKRVAKLSSDMPLLNGMLPAKRRKIKLQSIKVEDIQLPGTDERSRAREKRLNDTKNFLLELKALLEPASYYSLVNLIKKFNSKEDFQEAIKYLRALFPEQDEEFKSIFKRCYLLFTGEWEKEFIHYCEINNIS